MNYITANPWFAQQGLPWLEKLIEKVKHLSEASNSGRSGIPNLEGPAGAVLSFLGLIEVSTNNAIQLHQ